MPKKISIIVPCYNEEEVLPIFFQKLREVLETMPKYRFEMLFVDDGSADGTLALLKQCAQSDKRVRYISFSRNFGKESAIYAGLRHATGDYVALMDADLQDPPELLPEMADSLEKEGYESVATRRVTRKGEPRLHSFFARLFYRIINRMSNVQMMDGARDYRMMTRKMVDAVLSLTENNRFSKGIFSWVGFRTKWIGYENRSRAAGKTKWSFWKLFAYSIEGIVAFSTVPLSIATLMGLLFCGLAFLMVVVIVIKTLMFGDPVGGWPSLACIVLLVGGVQLFCAGISGKYLSKMYMELKNRPIYIIGEQNLESGCGEKKPRGKEEEVWK